MSWFPSTIYTRQTVLWFTFEGPLESTRPNFVCLGKLLGTNFYRPSSSKYAMQGTFCYLKNLPWFAIETDRYQFSNGWNIFIYIYIYIYIAIKCVKISCVTRALKLLLCKDSLDGKIINT